MADYTAFSARHGCGETLLYDGAPVYVYIETLGGLTQRVSLTTVPCSGAEPILDDAELECPCGKMKRSLAGEVCDHFGSQSRRWDREHPPQRVATGARP